MELFGVVYCILLFLSSYTQGSNAELVEKTSNSERRDVDTCVDNPLCATLPDICTNLDQALVKAQCPAKCGLCPTSEQTTLATVITTSPITTTTSSSTERYCVFDICMNGGTCVVVLSRHICECPQGVTGKYCESVHVSASFVTPTISTHSTTTQQTTPFPVSAPTSGPCDISPCINGGSCVANGFMFTCSCPDGYSGPLCNIEPQQTAAPTHSPSTTTDAGFCALSPCQNGGICNEGTGGFVCLCPPGFDHPVCSTLQSQTSQSTMAAPTTASTSQPGTTPNAHVNTAQIVAVATHGPTTAPIKGVECYVCNGPLCKFGLDMQVQTCDDATPFCLNTFEINAGAASITKRCVNEDECREKWLEQSSDQGKCVNLVAASTQRKVCHFCCVKDRCNKHTRPEDLTLYTGNN